MFHMQGAVVRRAKPTDRVFCARRAWDHGTEVGFMKEIEDRFQPLAQSIVDGHVSTFDRELTHVISSFFALWVVRTEMREQPVEDAVLQGVLPGRAWSRDQEERLEKAGLGFQRGITIPARQANGIGLRIRVGRLLREINPSASWGVVRASGGEFVVPDRPAYPFIPIEPTLALAHPAMNQTLDRIAVGLVNQQLRSASPHYYFARDLAACP
ncbi:hypothetical protein C7G42_14870 [Bradyrhizobium sp. MOS003]|nr:hypothetical protein C7G42_14870 [Bradyrhizobium sp. MOS003]